MPYSGGLLIVLVFGGFIVVTGRIKPGFDCRRSVQGTDYIGRVNVTESGYNCQRWDTQSPNAHNYTDGRYFADRNVSLAENSCRSPDGDSKLWCYTAEPGIAWEFCDVPKCSRYPECKRTPTGEEYRGHVAETLAGESCVEWGPTYPEAELNFCRNPDLRAGGPWCFVDEAQTQWEFCDVPFCKPSASCLTSPDGTNYVGTVSMTVTSKVCQRWDSSGAPHQTNFTSAEEFPDASLTDAENFCRNPGGSKNSPWCYTIDQDVEWEYCDIPMCTSCKVSTLGLEYAGDVAVTSSGRSCQRWDSQTPHSHDFTDSDRFPDASLPSAENYCRNPDRDPAGPWCLTSDPGVVREYCDVPLCQDDPSQPVRNINHVLHIGVDGLHPCFTNANATNILTRLAAPGSSTIDKGRSVLPSVSQPAWTTAHCSMGPHSSGVSSNSWEPTWLGNTWAITPSSGPNSPIPCLVDLLQRTDADVHTAFFYGWNVLRFLASTGSPGRLDLDYFCDADEVGGWAECDVWTTLNASDYLANLTSTTDRSYTFVYLINVDETGHQQRWCTPEYLAAVDVADGQIGMLLDAVESLNDVMVVLHSDHGGVDFGHGANGDPDLRIPVFFRGPGIKQGYEFQFEVSHEDIAPTIAARMGFPPSPWWSGQVIEEMFI